MSLCECGHDLGQHPPDPNRPFAWPCRACECNEYREVKMAMKVPATYRDRADFANPEGPPAPVVEDLDPHRTVTYLESGVPYCYMGHAECYDGHESERRADEADYEEDRSR